MVDTPVLGTGAERREGSSPFLSTMANKKPTLKEEKDYLAFLKKRLDSENYKNNATKEEYEKTKAKYDKLKLRLRLFE